MNRQLLAVVPAALVVALASQALAFTSEPRSELGPRVPVGAGLTGFHVVRGTTASDGTDFKWLTVKCPTGEIATGGGALIGGVSNASGIPIIFGSGPAGTQGWQANASSKSTGGPQKWNLIIDVVCARPTA